jgi:glycosyltransferase involved in cell wall biosynthesis
MVSIVVACRNGEKWLRQALDSCLNQTWSDLEVIVVDDASVDGSGAIASEAALRDRRVRVVRRDRCEGVAQAFNAGFAVARGVLLARLACDDYFEAGAIASLLNALEQHPDAVLAYAPIRSVDENGAFLESIEPPPPRQVIERMAWLGLCVLWRRDVWEELGGFDPEYNTAEEHEFWVRVYTRYPVAKVDGPPLLSWRRHGGQISSVGAGEATIANARLVCKYFSPPGGRRAWLAKEYFDASFLFRRRGRRTEAIRSAFLAAWYGPCRFRSWKALAAALFREKA